MQKVDVLIVGGAAVGSAAAYFLASQSDFKGSVMVLEQDFSYEKCATALSAASIRHQFSTPQNIQLSQFGSQFLKHIGDYLAVDGDVPDVGFHEDGYLFLATEAGREVLQSNHRIQKAQNVDVALLTPEELRTRYPWMQVDDLVAGSLGLSGEGWMDAYGLMRGLRRKAMALGAQYKEARVTALQREGHRIVAATLSDGSSVACGTVINTAGTGAAALARSAGIALPVEARKRSVFYFTTSAQLDNCPMVIDPSGAYFRPEGKGFICGVAPAPEDDPECYDFDVQHTLFDEVLWPTLAARAPALEALRVQRSWAGHYDMNTLDHNVILGAHPEVDNLLFANGFSGHGMQQSPAVGRALSELVTYGGYRTLDLQAFGWERVLKNQPLYEINVV
ncbi:FAD-binding oxidoreductase [Rhodoferax sp. GW822-FHT02A01]|uniref:NAD(P)/FAD-dependent oxidoreductase n=1 Tax=Rhodoferax sp. GW822-FHT02A01 TaxID=3141537 RepID=UPI00315D2E50